MAHPILFFWLRTTAHWILLPCWLQEGNPTLYVFFVLRKKKIHLTYDTFPRMVFYAIPTLGILWWFKCKSLFFFTKETLRLYLS